jgi:hypothetical protein
MIHNFDIEKPYGHILHVWKELVDKVPAVKGAKFTIRESTPEDLMTINVRREQTDTFESKPLDFCIRAHAWANLLSPMNYTILHGEDKLLMVTVMPVSVGIAEISFLTDQAFVDSPLAIRLRMLKIFKEGLEELPFRRLQAKVRCDFQIGVNFVQYLGFEQEGVLKEFGPQGHDYIIFGRLNK